MLVLLCSLLSAVPAQEIAASPADSWPGFRGVGTSHSLATDLPRTWSEEEGTSWSVELPGYGQSSPVVWGGQVFVTAVQGGDKQRCVVAAYSTDEGELAWSRSFDASVSIEATDYVSRAAPTPAVDGERIYAFFESGDLFALDHQGQLLWTRALVPEFGPYEGNHGVASSVVLDGEGVLLLLDHEGASYLIKFDRATGETLWKQDRDPRVSWATPVLAADTEELIVSSNGVLQGIDLADGGLHWELGDLRGNTVPSPTLVGPDVLVASSKDDPQRLVRRGSADEAPEVLWEATGARPSSFGSPLVAGGHVYIVNKSGALSCVSLETGELLWNHRLPESCWASPILADGLLWFFGKEGTTTVLRHGSHGSHGGTGPEVLAENVLARGTLHGVAVTQGSFFLRSGSRLDCVR